MQSKDNLKLSLPERTEEEGQESKNITLSFDREVIFFRGEGRGFLGSDDRSVA